MKPICQFLLLVIVTFTFSGQAFSQEAEQEITLTAGWNAVWLEVEPRYPAGHARAGFAMKPEEVFAATTAIEVIASPKPLAGVSEFFGSAPTSPNGTFNQASWEVWRKVPIDPNSLVMTTGNRAYLIKATSSAMVTITGKATFFRKNWTPDRYNLVGFGIDPSSSPTFDSFFGPSNGRHPITGDQKIFALNALGNWVPVNGGSAISPGAAYWVFSKGPSDYMGPVAVGFDLANTGKLNFSGPGNSVPVNGSASDLDLKDLVFTNLDSSSPATPTLDLISGSAELQLFVTSPAVDSLSHELGNQVDSSIGGGAGASLQETIAPLSTATLTLGARRTWTTAEVGRTNLYRLHPGGGAAFWLPVSAAKTDLLLPSDVLPGGSVGSLAGLWVGEVSVTQVTSIVEDGSPVRPAAGSAPVRVILHSDASGQVTLLSQVTVMQTQTADPEIAPVPVLVVDPQQIPFFEGVKERNGKRVGIRIQTVAYDMPRLIDVVGADQSDLVEEYHLTWPLTGVLGAGETVVTGASISLDPYHRSNPFRHAFHKKHSRGPRITRALSLAFDPVQPNSDRLIGTFTDTVTGLIQNELTLSGRIELKRVSAISSLASSN